MIYFAVLLAAACSNPDVDPPIDESIPSDPLFILPDAYRGNQQYFLRYRRDDKIYYAVGDLSETTIGGVPGMHVLQSIWHVFKSHTYTILMRPFSSIQSLLSVAFDTALETGRARHRHTRLYLRQR